MTKPDTDALSSTGASAFRKVTSWKQKGTTRLLFSSNKAQSPTFGTLECSLSSSASSVTPPRVLVSERIIACPRNKNDCFLLQTNPKDDNGKNMDMGTINAMLLSLKSAMLFRDVDDESSRHFVYAPRSLHSASLTEYNPKSTKESSPPAVKQQQVAPVAIEESPPVDETETQDAREQLEQDNQEIEPSTSPEIEAVDPSDLEKIYQTCIETGMPTPRDFCRQVSISLSGKDKRVLKNLLKTSTQLHEEEVDNVRTLLVQVGLRLLFLQNDKFPKFLKLHHEVVYKNIDNKKRRKRVKRSDPMEVLQNQVLNILSLVAIRCETPQAFATVVEDVCKGASEEMVKVIYNHFELVGREEEQASKIVKSEVAKKEQPVEKESSSPPTSLPHPSKAKEENANEDEHKSQEEEEAEVKAPELSDDISLVRKSVPLTASQSTRKNSLVPNQKRKYVGSHFGTRLSNATSLFRQVKVPTTATTQPKRQKRKQEQPTIKLDPRGRPPKRPRTISFQKRSKQVVTETPAKRLMYPSSPLALSPMGGRSDSQNARLVAQEALAAARRKSTGRWSM